MPTYDYICDACGHEFEAFEPITAQPRTDCPECKLPNLRRKIGPGAAILFKGSGFYQTDYRSESYKKAAKADTFRRRARQGKLRLQIVGRLCRLDQERARQTRNDDRQERVMIRGSCPICSKAYQIATLDDLPSFPFCSDRCRLVDLGPLDRWPLCHPAAPGTPRPRARPGWVAGG